MRKEVFVIIAGIVIKIIGHLLEMKSALPTRSDEISQQIAIAGYLKDIGLIVLIVGIILLIILPDFSKKENNK
jgi:hypothetical protein